MAWRMELQSWAEMHDNMSRVVEFFFLVRKRPA